MSATPNMALAATKAQSAAAAATKKKDKGGVHAVSGSVAGMFSKTVLQPMDLVKTRMQVGRYAGVGAAMRGVYAEGGARAFATGLTPNLIGSGAAWGVYFYTYSTAKGHFRARLGLEDPHAELPAAYNFVSAASAGTLTVFATNPIWMVKTRLQVQPADGAARYRGVADAFRRIVAEEGVGALYRGIGPALSLVSNGALQFVVYERLRGLVRARLGGDESSLKSPHFLAMGAAAKSVSATATYPLQVVRSRQYQQRGAGEPPLTARQIVRQVFRQHGVRGFYSGLVPQLCKSAPSSALTFFGYEMVLRVLSPLVDGVK